MGNGLYQIFEFVDQHYSLDDVKTLCFRLDVDYDNLPAEGKGKRPHARELVKYLIRRDQVPDLLGALQAERPDPFEKSNLSFDMKLAKDDSLAFLADEILKASQLQVDSNYYAYYTIPEHEQKIEQVLNELYTRNGRSVTMISGLGGIGKTAVAIELIRRALQDAATPFRKITWNSAKQNYYVEGEIQKLGNATISLESLTTSIGRQLAGSFYEQQPIGVQRDAFLRQLLQDTPSLIVVDNLESLDNAGEIIAQLKGMMGASKLLLTSRQEAVGDYFLTRLHGLTIPSSAEFIENEAASRNFDLGRQLKKSTIEQIHTVTGGMPLALKLVVSQSGRLGLARTLARLQTGSDDIYQFIFRSTWEILSALSRKLLMYMGSSPQGISFEELEMVAEDAEATLTELDASLDELVRFSLVNTYMLAGFGEIGYSIHQLTRQFVVNDLPQYWQTQES